MALAVPAVWEWRERTRQGFLTVNTVVTKPCQGPVRRFDSDNYLDEVHVSDIVPGCVVRWYELGMATKVPVALLTSASEFITIGLPFILESDK